MKNNIILGAGLSGLSAAYHLTERSDIYERGSEIGGLCRSVVIDGFTYDYGPHILYSIDAYTSGLIQDLLRGNISIIDREASIYHKRFDCYTTFPFQAHLYGLPVSIVLKCLADVFAAYINRKKAHPANYKEWMYKNFGRGITEHLMIPYAKKIWTLDPSLMNFDWIERRIPQPDLKMILEGAVTNTSRRAGFNKEFWYPIKGGIEPLPVSLAKRVENIHLNMEATRIFPKKRKVEFNNTLNVPYDRLISTLPLPEVIKLIKDAPPAVKKAAGDLEYTSIFCVNLGIDRERISDYHWLYFYEDEFVFHRISFPMNFSESTAPRGKSSISCEIAYSKHRPIDKEGMKDKTVEGLIEAKILRKDDRILVNDALDIKYAYIIYDISHRKNVGIIHSYLKEHDIYPCGRFGDWEYLNMDHSIASGKVLADSLNNIRDSQ